MSQSTTRKAHHVALLYGEETLRTRAELQRAQADLRVQLMTILLDECSLYIKILQQLREPGKITDRDIALALGAAKLSAASLIRHD